MSLVKMKIAFIVDPLSALKAYKDSSIAMMRAAAKRGHEVWTIQREGLHWRDGRTLAHAVKIRLHDEDDATWFSVAEKACLPLTVFSAVLMRQDPPFDFEYITATWLLQRAESEGARIFNRPQAIRDHSEKVAIAEFPAFAPTTLISRHPTDVHDFINELGEAILKPLDGMGGSSIFHVKKQDPNRNVIVEMLTHFGARSIMAQQYLPAIREGDKRVLLIGGEPVPYCLARIPMAGETRGNLAAGGTGVAQPLSVRDREIAVSLAPTLWARGLMIVGLDVIGDKLTEINVTSPTCFVEIAEQTGFDVAGMLMNALERACASG
ncbi:MAG: glutathione synthase [Rugosibacter sp.]|nr:glutathione synthase [Rugosibacter sp.]